MEEKIIWAITEEQVQDIAKMTLGRNLTEDEMEEFQLELSEQDELLAVDGVITEIVEGFSKKEEK